MHRRHFLGAVGLVSAAAALPWLRRAGAAEKAYPVAFTDAQWHQRLTPAQFEVLREEGTEIPFTSPLLHETRRGKFTCAGCNLPAYSSDTKYDSHTGWPSFWAPIDGAIGTTEDHSFGVIRTAVHCSQCGGHLGHVFDDGPRPTGLRYCMNGVAMGFVPTAGT
jgi:peptide-methionine (R)-S-oxide reductase